MSMQDYKISKCMGAFTSRNRYCNSEKVLSGRCTTLEQGGNREREGKKAKGNYR